MNIFFTADLHLGHDNIRRHCRRPFGTVEEMDEAIIANWNGAVIPSSSPSSCDTAPSSCPSEELYQ